MARTVTRNCSDFPLNPVYKQLQISDRIKLGYDRFCINCLAGKRVVLSRMTFTLTRDALVK